jgi:(2S)-methylsuccinyl-CoA dehydrogenase
MSMSDAVEQGQDVRTLATDLAEALERTVDEACIATVTRVGVDNASIGGGHEQGLLFDLATISAGVVAGREVLDTIGDDELALIHLSRTATDAMGRLLGRDVPLEHLDAVRGAVAAGRDARLVAQLAERVLTTGEAGPRGLTDELEMVRESFRAFAKAKVAPVAERIHREDLDVPEDIIRGLAKLGTFALSVPEEYGGLIDASHAALFSMLVATEELSRASLGAAGSLTTRPEIVANVIARAGTTEQRERWLPEIASGARMTSIAVTEPGAGSDVAAIRVTARREGDSYVIDGVKTWCTFAGRAEYLMILARTDMSPGSGHRGLSLIMVEKPAMPGHAFELDQAGGGRIEGRAIPTLGYRGMHSFEVSFDGWRVPANALLGGDEQLGRGFYLQMEAFANARVQTAARAQGIMQAALDAATSYTGSRHLFDAPLSSLPLTREKLAMMAATLTASRALTMRAARLIVENHPEAGLSAAQSKLLAGGSAEWIVREAMQLHGGYGYAEEYTVSRLFVDARVLSIFEGANEVLALKIIGRALLNRAARMLGD